MLSQPIKAVVELARHFLPDSRSRAAKGACTHEVHTGRGVPKKRLRIEEGFVNSIL